MKAFLICLFLLAGLGTAQAAMRGVPDSGQLAFTVMRNGDPIGRHIYNFESQGGTQIVRVQTRILYVLLGIPFYRFEHDSKEVWQKGHLVSLTSSTNDDGKKIDLKLQAEGANLLGDLNGEALTVEKTTLPASLWNPATTKASSLADTVDGDRLEVESKPQDDYFTLRGKLNRDLWYDKEGVLVQTRFTARDGSEIRYVRD